LILLLNFVLRSFELVSSFGIRISDLLLFPPQTRIVLPSENLPNVVGVINRLAYRVKSA